MKLINAYLLALTLCFAGVATADHKPGHPLPTTGTDLSDLSCAEGQTIAIVDGVWVCADFPTGAALTGLERVVALSVVQPDSVVAGSGGLSTQPTQMAEANCGSGKKVLGGGYYFPFAGAMPPIESSVPNITTLDGWSVSATNPNYETNPWRLAAVAMCADAQ